MIQSIIREDDRAAAPFGTGKILRLVRYCLRMDNADLAQKLIHTITQIVLELVSPVNLPQPNWIVENDR